MNCHIENQISVRIDPNPESLARLQNSLEAQRIAPGPFHTEAELGLVRFTASALRRARSLLAAMGLAATDEQVLAIDLNGSKGQLTSLTSALSRSGIAIDYIYPEATDGSSARRLIVKVSNLPMAMQLARSLSRAA